MTEENNEKQSEKKSFVPVVILAIVVFGVVGYLYNSKNKDNPKNANSKTEQSDKKDDKLKIDVNDDKQWADAMGYIIGKQIKPSLKPQLLVEDPKKYEKYVLKGIKEAFDEKDDKEKFTIEEIQKILEARGEVAEKRLKDMGEKNKKAGEEFVKKYEKEEGVEKTKGGTLYKKLKEGEGEVVGKNIAKVNYAGKHIDGKEFDSSKKHGDKPVPFTSDRILPGLGEALELMKKGDKWEIVVPVELAYGEQSPPGIEPNEALIFEIEIVDIEEKKEQPKVSNKTPKFQSVETIEAEKNKKETQSKNSIQEKK